MSAGYFNAVVFVYCRYLRFDKKANDELAMVVNGLDSSLTPWPVKRA